MDGRSMNPYDSITCTGSMGMISARSFREGFCEHPFVFGSKDINFFCKKM